MRQNIDRSSVVIVGAWNLGILNPNWIHERVFEGQESEQDFQVQVDFGVDLRARYLFQGLRFVVLPGRVQFFYEEATDECMQRCEEAALRLLEALPETPVSSFGVNFAYDLTEAGNVIEPMLDLPDQANLGAVIGPIERLDIKRRIAIASSEGKVNLTIGQDLAGGDLTLDFNHHYDVRDARAAIDLLRGKLREARELSEQVTRRVFLLDLPEDV